MDPTYWSLDDAPARVIDLREPGSLNFLIDYYASQQPSVLSAVLAQAFTAGAQTAVVEYRYIDADYRDEHSQFYSTTFRRYPSVAHRLHFFSEAAVDQVNDPTMPIEFGTLGYLGYAVMRPVGGAPVGRVLLAIPPSLDGVTCFGTETVNLFGENLKVTGTPFLAQDAQLLRCAHAALWVVARHHHLEFKTQRLLPSAIVNAVPLESAAGRTVPSPGLTVNQMSTAATRLGLPPLVYDVNRLPPGESIQRIACRYLNSGLPVIVAGGGHAFVLVGYRRELQGTPDERIAFIRQDDEVGPYQVVPDFEFDDYSPWAYLIVPLPPKLYVAGEEAEMVGRAWLRQLMTPEGATPVDYAYRTTAIRSNDYKAELLDRGVPAAQAAVLRRAPMSRWIWVVEAVDRSLRSAGVPAVIAEAVIDATDHARDRRPIGWRLPESTTVITPDTAKFRTATAAHPAAPVRYVRGR